MEELYTVAKEFAHKMGNPMAIFFYYSGHGFLVSNNNEKTKKKRYSHQCGVSTDG